LENADLPSYWMPKASIFDRVACAMVSSEPTGWKMPVTLAGSPVSTPKGTTSSISKSTASPMRIEWRRPVLDHRDGARSRPRFSLTSGPSASMGPPRAPEKTPPSLAAWSSEAAASMKTPSRQLPSLMTLGVSTTAATVRPPTSVPSTSPLWMLNTSTTLQRSWVAPSASDAVQGHTTSHEQVSKYDPAIFQATSQTSGGRARVAILVERARTVTARRDARDVLLAKLRLSTLPVLL